MAELLDALGGVLTRWTMGGAAATTAPPDWRGLLGEEAGEAELRLLALSGQYLGALVVAEPQGAVSALPDLPRLALPMLPESLRPLVRRLLQAEPNTLLAFLAGRGWTVHPADWLPSAKDEDVPEVYAPWRDWVAGAISGGQLADTLTAENWDDFAPAQRSLALAVLRRSDPDAARALIETRLAEENAETRLRWVQLFATGLSDADAPLLEQLKTKDRAPKVKALANALLARLGRTVAGADMAELLDFFIRQPKGVSRRSKAVTPKPLKTQAQRTRRRQLLEETDFPAFAAALEMEPLELFTEWNWKQDEEANGRLVEMVARSASDAVVLTLCKYHIVSRLGFYRVGRLLTDRLPQSMRTELVRTMLKQDDARYSNALYAGDPDFRIDDAIACPAGAKLIAELTAQHQAGMVGKAISGERHPTAPELQALGLIASRTAARQALDKLLETGLLLADPRLDMLRLNAALEDRLAESGEKEHG